MHSIFVALTAVWVYLIATPFNSLKAQHATETDINAIWQAFTIKWEEKDATGCASFYLPDGLNIPAGFPVAKGQNEIELFYANLFNNHKASTYTHRSHYISNQGSLAIELGEFVVDWIRLDGSKWTFKARSLTHWEKDSQGQWRIKSLLFNSPPEANE